MVVPPNAYQPLLEPAAQFAAFVHTDQQAHEQHGSGAGAGTHKPAVQRRQRRVKGRRLLRYAASPGLAPLEEGGPKDHLAM